MPDHARPRAVVLLLAAAIAALAGGARAELAYTVDGRPVALESRAGPG